MKFLLAPIPGLIQVLQGRVANGLSLLSALFGMLLVLYFDPGWFTAIFILVAYLSLVYHAAKDAFHNTTNTESIQYILGLAVVIGPFSLPLLWQNRRLLLGGKLIWTSIILAITALAIVWMIYLDPIVANLQTTR